MDPYGSKKDTVPTIPDFFVVGAAKSGTTSLYHYLDQHPDVYMPRNKEPHYFSRVPPFPGRGSHPVTSEEEYLDLFKLWNKESVAGEASPSYLWDEKAPYRIKETVPQAKIIAILRHPVERAYSHYLMDVKAASKTSPSCSAESRSTNRTQGMGSRWAVCGPGLLQPPATTLLWGISGDANQDHSIRGSPERCTRPNRVAAQVLSLSGCCRMAGLTARSSCGG
jgi:Sulfotransferase family